MLIDGMVNTRIRKYCAAIAKDCVPLVQLIDRELTSERLSAVYSRPNGGVACVARLLDAPAI